jgi:hypothetical protein
MSDLEQSITAYSQALEDLHKAFEERGIHTTIETYPSKTQEELDEMTEMLQGIAEEVRNPSPEVSND